MQQRSVQNQQNQNPNVGATSSSAAASSNEVKANLDSVLEISMDKRNAKNNNRGGKRKRINLIDDTHDSSAVPTTSGQ